MPTQQSFSPKHIQFRLSDEALWQRLEDAAVAASRSPNQVAKQLVIDALGSSSYVYPTVFFTQTYSISSLG